MNPNETTVAKYYRERVLLLNPRIRTAAAAAAVQIDLDLLGRYWSSEYPNRIPDRPQPMLGDLSVELLAGAAAWRVRLGRSPATANRLLRHCRAVWSFAADDELLSPRMPQAPKLRKFKEPKRTPDAWSIDELERLLTVANQQPGKVGDIPASLFWPTLLGLLYWTGARISAAMQLRPDDVDLAGGWVRFAAESQKQFADQRFPITPDLGLLIAQIDAAGRNLPTVFADWHFDRTVAQWPALNRHLKRILVAAGLPAGRSSKFHRLRRTFATQVCSKAGIGVAQALLGHSSQATTRRYIDTRYVERPDVRAILPAVNLRVVG